MELTNIIFKFYGGIRFINIFYVLVLCKFKMNLKKSIVMQIINSF